MNETRVNLKHLLEDIRDSYSYPIEEVIIREPIANALDSGAFLIKVSTDAGRGTMTITDNGHGMRRPVMRDYHNIAATAKERGKGIGFAGVGAKLSLLLAKSVTTETRGGYGSKCTTYWRLTSDTRAPWKFVPSPGLISTPRGTAVTIEVEFGKSKLLDQNFLAYTIQKHYLPLFLPVFHENILRFLYKKGVEFWVNNQKLGEHNLSKSDSVSVKTFPVRLGDQAKRLVGFGYLAKSVEELPEGERGVGVSCFGKVIKRGWEWIGISPKSFRNISGLVEIPSLAELLTTNKSDFLSDATSLKKYYRYRKLIQEKVLASLEDLGEHGAEETGDQKKRLKPLEKEIEKTLGGLATEFPELISLVGIKRKIINVKTGKNLAPEDIQVILEAKSNENVSAKSTVVEKAASKSEKNQIALATLSVPEVEAAKGTGRKSVARRSPGLKIRFEQNDDPTQLGRMLESDLWINTAHPAYQRAKDEGLDEYHIILATAWVLAGFVEQDKSPHEFVNRFLSIWGKKDEPKSRETALFS